MFKNYLKIAWRNLLKNKGYTAINIVGLSVGVCCFLLISLFVKNEFSYDKFHSKADRIYRVWQYENYGPKEDFLNTTTPVSMMKVLKSNFPEIEEGSRVYQFNSLVKRNTLEFNESVRAVDPSFFQMFDFELLEGNQDAPLTDVNSIILSTSAAKKYFGSENPIGQSLELQFDEESRLLKVSAIMADPPEESSIQFNMLVSLENETLFFGERSLQSWFSVAVESYVLLDSEASASRLEAKFSTVIEQHLGSNYQEDTFFLHLQPLTDIHLDTSLPAGIEPISNPVYSYVLASIGFLVLLLACINFVTLSLGRSFSRAVEVGVRKALGAFRKQILYQFWGEALLVTLLAVVLGIGLSYLSLGAFNQLSGKNLHLSLDLNFLGVTLGLIIFIAMIAGIYPSLILSRFNPIEVLVRKKLKGASMGLFGKGLIITQFAASIVMIISTFIISQQIDFLVNKDLGYQKEAIVVVPTNTSGEDASTLSRLYLAELEKQPKVLAASSSTFSFIENSWAWLGYTDNQNVYREFAFNSVDAEFLNTHNIAVSSGRGFQQNNISDAENGVLVNETFVREFGLKNPVGTVLETLDVTILGVVKDFNFQSLNFPIEPLLLAMNLRPVLSNVENAESQYSTLPRISVRLDAANVSSSIAMLKKSWENVNPSQEFEYAFLDESLTAQYRTEQRSKTIVNIASILSIFIACMGLFGLATLTVARRTAEIGIRKVLGAGVLDIVAMITRDFVKLVLIAALIAFPIAWWAMEQWLQDFAYSISISWWIFALAGIIVVGITLCTVGFQSIKASLTNPVDSLRAE
ncbi:ABC transporter permease [Spongiimicrobium salis]|uniref:ABC transporter permease n=1 Tax=Spongiimicrobium salis TaxID=1667022 RepID=UPI00374D19CD